MGYTALLFCPDEKTARTVTQVLSELEFAVEACTEPFAAVKKLMGQHFDAVVVDCDNEQNATLLFKSARNSTPNQTSLAVAVVEGQAGVAKAFRIGANLVLTKPINIEQAKGTLRVARGLLRKSDPAKPATAAPSASAAEIPSKPAAPRPVSEPKAPATSLSAARAAARTMPAIAASKSTSDDDLLGIESDQPHARPATASAAHGAAGTARVPGIDAKSTSQVHGLANSGAASAPAPAREHKVPEFVKETAASPAIAIPETRADSNPAQSAPIVGSAPSFTFGGANTAEPSSGGAKKIIVGLVAAIVLVAAGYAGWTHFHGTMSQSATATSTSASTSPSESAHAAAPAETETAQPHSTKPSATSQPSAQPTSTPIEPKKHTEEAVAEGSTPSRSAPAKSTPEATNQTPDQVETPEEEPLIVKGGKVAQKSKPPAADDAAPSLIGLATPGASTPPPNFVPTTEGDLRPKLQTLNISQGVSQGLLYKKVAPAYPPNAIRMRVEGTVELMATISKTGDITGVKILSGDKQLTKSAADAVKQWKYKPYLLNGEPVEIQTQVTINFKLPR